MADPTDRTNRHDRPLEVVAPAMRCSSSSLSLPALVERVDGRTDGSIRSHPEFEPSLSPANARRGARKPGRKEIRRTRTRGRQEGDFPSSCERSCERLFVRTQYILRIGAQTAHGAHMGSHHVDAIPTRSPSRSSQQLPGHNVNAHLARSPPPLLHCEVRTRPFVVRRSHHI